MSGGRLDGKVAIVTAAGQGIGRAIAERLRDDGAKVHASDLNADLLSETEGMETRALDATDPTAVEAYMAHFDRIDALVHAVGYVHQGTIEQCDLDAWNRSRSISLDSAYFAVRSAISRIKIHGGSIVLIASVASSIKGFPKRAAYGSMKAGLIGLTKSVACDYVTAGVRCNAICPGTVDSPSLRARMRELADQFGDEEKARRFFLERQPAGRLGTPEEIAGLASYLASDESALVTGQAISIDGGIMI